MYSYKNKTGDEPRKQDTQANQGSPLLSEEVPYQITLIRLSQGSLDSLSLDVTDTVRKGRGRGAKRRGLC